MKKTLAIVLALVMVLAMIPAMGAATETKISSNDYDLLAYSVTNNADGDMVAIKDFKVLASKDSTNALTVEYYYEDEVADVTDKWADNAKMALIKISNWDAEFNAVANGVKGDKELIKDKTAYGFAADQKVYDYTAPAAPANVAEYAVTVDGDKIDVGEADYEQYVGVGFEMTGDTNYDWKKVADVWNGYSKYFAKPYVIIPVQLTKAGYQDTVKVALTHTDANGNVVKETAEITLKLVNKSAYKDEKTAIITNIESDNTNKVAMNSYIVGGKIYLDYVEKATKDIIKITFATADGAPFTATTYAQQPKAFNGVSYVEIPEVISPAEDGDKYAAEYKLSDSVAKFNVNKKMDTDVKFILETQAATYETKDYDIVVREYIKEEDPKGIYFTETTKTIAMGQTYAPVVMGVKTGKVVAAGLAVGEGTDKQVVDIVDGNKVIGTREGIAYITASYKPAGGEITYTAASMKVIVTLPGESIPELEPSAEVYYVTCRTLNVRRTAGTTYKAVDQIHRGDAVKVVEIANGWAKLDDGTYVCAKYISK